VTTRHPYGFLIRGGLQGRRVLVDVGQALRGYAQCLPEARVGEEAYLSAFHFDAAFRDHLVSTASTRDFLGPCWAPWLWCDLDGPVEDLHPVLAQARALGAFVAARYALDDDELLAFFSGRRGFCIGLPTPSAAKPSPTFHRAARIYAEALALQAGAKLDLSVFNKVQPLRAPNSRHPKSGLHKVRLELKELFELKIERILELAREPRPFDWYEKPCARPQAQADWQAAIGQVRQLHVPQRPHVGDENRLPRLNRQTLDFIKDGAGEGDRHRLLFSAAANLAEYGCTFELAWALLSPAALDSGLPPREVERQIRCGLDHVDDGHDDRVQGGRSL
jgi:hypothetical protein